jgi:RHS repeat-associated protein
VSSGLLISQTDANNHKTTFNYDASLRQTTRTRDTASGGDGGVISRTYVSSKQISITSPNGNGGTADVEQIADDYGRPIRAARKIVSTSGRPWVITDTCYDANGRVFFKSLPYTAANLTGSQVCSGSGDTISYDGIGRTHSITHSDGSTVDYVYKGRATKVTEESNGSTRVAKITQVDGLGRITAVCELSNTALVRGGMTFSPQLCGLDVDSSSAVGFLTTYSYNLAAHTTTSTQGSGSNTQTRTWTTDAFGRPTSESIPEAQGKDVSGATGSTGITTYAYDYNSTGLKVTRTKPQANILSGSTVTTTETQFDALGRPQSIQYRTGGVADTDTPDVSFNYDVSTANNAKNMLGRLASISSAHGSVFYSYTTNGQVKYKATTLPNNLCSFTVQTYSYDLLGNLVQASDDIGGSTIANIYDSAANPQQVQAAAGSSSLSPIVSGFNYDAYGITSLQFGNGWTGQMSYDARGRMNGFAAQSGGITQYGYNLNWNNNGSLASATDTANGSWSYSYDDFNRLVSATQNSGSPTTYQYDVFGNRYPINNGAGGSAIFTYDLHNHNSLFAYDENGNTVATPQVDSDFDAEGRVVRVRAHNGTTVIAAYVYGPEGDRILATRGSKVTEYFYGIGGDLRMTRINGAVAKVQVNTPVGQVGSFVSGAFQYEFHDWNGSSRMNVSSAGTILKTFQSDAFGANSNAATDDVAQVNALDVDAEAYSAHAGARDYYPSYGVWNAPDPFGGSYDFGDPQSLNRYAYVGNSPVSYNDPTGLARVDNAPLESPFSTGASMYGGVSSGNLCDHNGDVCSYVREAWDWISSHLASSSVSYAAADGISGFNPNQTQQQRDAENNAEQWSRSAFATAGQMAVHPAQQAPPVKLQGNRDNLSPGRYRTSDAAAVGALDSIYDQSVAEQTEYAGNIVQLGPHSYTYSLPARGVPNAEPGESNPDDSPFPLWASKVGEYHTHPHALAAKRFSGSDGRRTVKSHILTYTEMAPSRWILRMDGRKTDDYNTAPQAWIRR